MRKIIFAVLCLMAQWAVADWQLNNKASTLNFISTKNASVTEVHTFKKLSGGVKNNGEAILNISLDSVETNIPIRNERLKQFLFEIDVSSEASVVLDIDPDKVQALAPGSQIDLPVKAKLSLHGVSQAIDTRLRVVKLQNNGIAVSTTAPIILSTGAFGFQSGLDKLKEIAKLDSITTAVPVTMNLVFDWQ